MIPVQTFEDFPEFCDTGTKTKPDSAKYSAGFVEADVLPAEWLNYFENKSSAGITALNRGVKSIENEMTSVLSAAGKTASETDSSQLVSSIKYLISQAKNEAILASHPVGSLYWTESEENPNVTFGGGTWVQIKDKFILAAGDSHTNKESGGSETVTLTVNNLPSHNHTYTPSGTVASHVHGMAHVHSRGTMDIEGKVTPVCTFVGGTSFTHTGAFSGSSHANYFGNDNGQSSQQRINLNFKASNNWTGYTSIALSYNDYTSMYATAAFAPAFTGTEGTTLYTGGSSAFSVMPPYIAMFCWKRTV